MKKQMSAEKMEELFDNGDMRYLEYFDLNKMTRPKLEQENEKPLATKQSKA